MIGFGSVTFLMVVWFLVGKGLAREKAYSEVNLDFLWFALATLLTILVS